MHPRDDRSASLKHPPKCLLVAVATAWSIAAASGQVVLVAGWDFQTTSNGGTALSAQDAAQPTTFTANLGSGTLFLDGSNGSSSWVSSATTSRELNAFAGTSVNATGGLSTTTTSPAALALVNSTANGNYAVFKFSMSGYKDLSISYATQRTSTGFTSQLWEYSTDGNSYSAVATISSGSTSGTIATSFATSGILTLPTVTGLDFATDAYLRVTFSGATSTAGNNRWDNIQFNASAVPVPEPETYALMAGIGLVGFAFWRRVRRA